MTQPNPDTEAAAKAAAKAAAEREAAEKAAAAKAFPGKVVKGALVTYRHPDPVTGGVLEGAGVVLVAPEEGAVTIAPLSPLFLDVDPDNVFLADAGEED